MQPSLIGDVQLCSNTTTTFVSLVSSVAIPSVMYNDLNGAMCLLENIRNATLELLCVVQVRIPYLEVGIDHCMYSNTRTDSRIQKPQA